MFVCYPMLVSRLFKLFKSRSFGAFVVLDSDWSLDFRNDMPTSHPLALFFLLRKTRSQPYA